ncbi:MAG: Arm DNA-binding domain-containing protein [Desulfovibrionaceae bacterium]
MPDGGGLFRMPTGGKSWRMKYRLNGQEKWIVFGLWPDVTLKQAWQRRDEARSLVAGGSTLARPSSRRRPRPAPTP